MAVVETLVLHRQERLVEQVLLAHLCLLSQGAQELRDLLVAMALQERRERDRTELLRAGLVVYLPALGAYRWADLVDLGEMAGKRRRH